jgi:glycosyltransferase involved in cell wall biosynthesis
LNIALLAPSPIPFVVGGAEKLWLGLHEAVRAQGEHRIELIKIPVRDREFAGLIAGYRAFAELDLSRFDRVISTKYPAWAARHPCHVVYLQHKLRGLYDTYPEHLGRVARLDIASLAALRDELSATGTTTDDFFDLLDAVEIGMAAASEYFTFPGPLTRAIVHRLDAISLSSDAIHKYCAISQTVRQREDYFAQADKPVDVIYHPSDLHGMAEGGTQEHFFTASRLEHPKRIHLLIDAMRHVSADVPLVIAGEGPEAGALKARARGDDRIRFIGFVTDGELLDHYRRALAVLFVPDREDYGLITIEALTCGKPVITCSDSGGSTELVQHDRNGWICEANAQAIGAAMQRMAAEPEVVLRLGAAARSSVGAIDWQVLAHKLINEL